MRLDFSARALAALAIGFVASGVAGCGDDDVSPDDAGVGDAMVDAVAFDVVSFPDGARPCTTASECDDGVDCTDDSCTPMGYCRHDPNPGLCDDGVFCNGREVCNTLSGCVRGAPEACNDDDVCTIDRCDEAAKLCRHTSRDFDGDGEADWHCEGGTDCDDFDPLRGATSSEVCDDTIDNDCDEFIDEAECGRPAHDVCEDPLDVSAGGAFELTTEGALSDYTLGCGGAGRKDLVLSFTLTEPKSVVVRADADFALTAVALRTECDSRPSELECATGFPGELRRRELAAGTYFVIVSTSTASPLLVEVEFGAPIPPASNETCDAPIDVSAGGRFTGSFVDAEDDDLGVSCASSLAPDLVYRLTLDEPKNVTIALSSESAISLAFSLRRDCDDPESQLRCASGAPARTKQYSLAAGTYFIVVAGSSFVEVDFALDVTLEAPTAPPPGDRCSDAVALTLGTPVLGTLTDREDDVAATCASGYRDAVYSFTLTERKDVTLEVDGDGAFMAVSARTTCETAGSELRCATGDPARVRLRDLAPGTYFVVVESFSGTGFQLTSTVTDPVAVTPVTGNETCATAFDVPAAGGIFTGDTRTMLNDLGTAMCGSAAASPDAMFKLVLSARKRVVANLSGSLFDTVLYYFGATCTTAMELACDDDGGDGTTSLLDRTLDAGTYHFVVDGFGSGSSGTYELEFAITDP